MEMILKMQKRYQIIRSNIMKSKPVSVVYVGICWVTVSVTGSEGVMIIVEFMDS